MVTMYEAVFCVSKIGKVVVVKETNKFYILNNGIRKSKNSSYSAFCKTFEEAKNELKNYNEKEIRKYKSYVSHHEMQIKNIEKLKEEDIK